MGGSYQGLCCSRLHSQWEKRKNRLCFLLSPVLTILKDTKIYSASTHLSVLFAAVPQLFHDLHLAKAVMFFQGKFCSNSTWHWTSGLLGISAFGFYKTPRTWGFSLKYCLAQKIQDWEKHFFHIKKPFFCVRERFSQAIMHWDLSHDTSW